MTELLAPAGNIEAFMAAISNGCDAIYLGMNRFGARAYAKNFDLETLKEAVKYAHLRHVKVYVTMNTIIFDEELQDAYKQIDDLYLIGIDGIIAQDLAIIEYIVQNYPLMEAHASTQMGIDDLDGVEFLESIGVKRAVLGRETPISRIKEIKKVSKMPIEIFVHGALCVSYSGNCLMSGLLGYRSGNRGRCVGSCRKPYELIDVTNNISYGTSYILSMKDLNTIEHINELKIADSLKIEGRMKEPEYVANIVRSYREALDNPQTDFKKIDKNLRKTFNRTFTKGYIFNEDKRNVINVLKPNHHGYEIGYIAKKNKNRYTIDLIDTLNQNDQIRIASKEEVNYPVIKMYDKNMNLINSADKTCILEIKEPVLVGDKVFKTRDNKFNDELNKTYPKQFKRFPIALYIDGKVGTPLTLSVAFEDYFESITSDFILEQSQKSKTTYDSLFKQLNRLNDTPYIIDHLEVNVSEDVFIPSSKLNELRRNLIEKLNDQRLKPRQVEKKVLPHQKIAFNQHEPQLIVYCENSDHVKACQELGIKNYYYENVIRRNDTIFNDNLDDVLVCGYNGIKHYQGKNITSDFSLNVVNHKAVYKLHQLGVYKITLSHEINKQQIDNLVENYYAENDGYPNLEMIIYGHTHLLQTKYCPLRVNNLCGKCRENKYILKDDYSYFPILSSKDCITTLLNGKVLNLIDELDYIKHINFFRVQLTIETYDESKEILNNVLNKLNHKTTQKFFNNQTDTRGHFNKEAMSKIE